MTKGRKIAIGVVIAAGAPFFIAGAIHGATSNGQHAASSPAPTRTAFVSHAPAPSPSIHIDQAGDTGTPCAMTYQPTSGGDGTLTRFTISEAGELITHVDGPDGLHRHDQKVAAGTIAFTYDVALPHIADAGAILQVGDKRWTCSIAAGR